MGRGLRRRGDAFRAHDAGIARRDRTGGPHRRALDHRAPGRAARIVRIGEPRAGRGLHAGGGEVALRQVRSGIAGHFGRVGRIPRDRARRRIARIADGAGRGLRVLCPGGHARHHPQHQADQHEHRGPGQQPDHPRAPVQRDLDAIAGRLVPFRHGPSSPAGVRDDGARHRGRRLPLRRPPPALRSGRCFRSRRHGMARGRRRSPGSRTAARRPERRPRQAPFRCRTGGTGGGRWRPLPPPRPNGRRCA